MQAQAWSSGNHHIVVPYFGRIVVSLDPKELKFVTEGDLTSVVYEPLDEAAQGLTSLEAYYRLCSAIEYRLREFREHGGMEEIRTRLTNRGWTLGA